jgi:hypothetical protein
VNLAAVELQKEHPQSSPGRWPPTDAPLEERMDGTPPVTAEEPDVLDRLFGIAHYAALPGDPKPALLLVVEARRQPMTAAARALLGSGAGSSPFLYDALVTDGGSKAVVVLHPDLGVLVEASLLRAGAQIEVRHAIDKSGDSCISATHSLNILIGASSAHRGCLLSTLQVVKSRRVQDPTAAKRRTAVVITQLRLQPFDEYHGVQPGRLKELVKQASAAESRVAQARWWWCLRPTEQGGCGVHPQWFL